MMSNDDFLIHYGVLGMKWGVRKDRNSSSSKRREKAKNTRKQLKAVRKSRKKAMKNRSILPEKELDKRINRLEKEKKLKELTEEEIYKGKQAAKKAALKFGDKAFNVSAGLGSAAATTVVTTMVKKKMASK